jgi:hypothetical protein
MQTIIKILNNEGGFLAGLIPGGLNLIGNMLGVAESRKQRKQQASQVQKNREDQYAFAKNSIQWRAADAKKAGIHPLAAMGASTYSPSPSMVDGGGSGMNASDVIKGMGQDISRAMAAKTTEHQRQVMDEQLKGLKLENEMKDLEVLSQRRRMGMGQTPPPTPGVVQNVPSKQISHKIGRPDLEAGQNPTSAYTRGRNGVRIPIPSERFQEGTEEMIVPSAAYQMDNYIAPMFGGTDSKPDPKYELTNKEKKAGYKDFEWSYKQAGWMPVKHKSRSPFKRFKAWFKKSIRGSKGKPNVRMR